MKIRDKRMTIMMMAIQIRTILVTRMVMMKIVVVEITTEFDC
jgi:hypothetical protein